jgi:hypothetical protein
MNNLVSSRRADSGIARSIIAGLAGFVAYGGWAYHVNAEYGLATGIRSGLVQGGYSFVLTLSTTLLMEQLLVSLSNIKGQIVITILTTCLITFSTAYLTHWLAKTPEILLTIAPGFLIGAGYTVIYVYSLSTLSKSVRAV